MQKTVLDISYANPSVDFAKVKATGISDVIIRTGYLGKTDTYFEKHIQGAIKNKFNIGVYTYIMSKTVDDARIEAEQTIQRLAKYKGYINYPVFCDMEDERYHNGNFGKVFDRRLCTDIIKTFCDTIRKGGYYPALYINPAWLENYVYKSELIGKYDIWLAAWTGSPSKPTRFNYNQTMWQWGTSIVNGIMGSVDTNLVYVDYPAVVKKSGLNFLPQTVVSNSKSINNIMKSHGTAAIRTAPSKSGNITGRVVKGGYYAFDEMITLSNGQVWLKHYGKKLYSMLIDGQTLFSNTTTYSVKFTSNALNVRSKPSLEGDKMTVLKQGEKVLVFDGYSTNQDGYTWVKILVGDKVGYVASKYLK